MFGNDFDWDEIFKSLDRVSVPDATDEENLEKLSDEDLELDGDFELGEDLRTSEENQRELLNIDRINVYDIESYELKEILASLSNEDKIKLFDRIVERIKSTHEDGYGNNQLILSLPPEIRIRYVDYYDFTQWDSVNDFIAGMVNENDIFTVAATGLNAIGENETYSVLKMFSTVPSSRKIEFMLTSGGPLRPESVRNGLKMINSEYVLVHDGARCNLKKEIIDSSYVADYLKQFEINQRFDIIQNVIFKKFQTKYEENYQHNEPNVRFDPWRYSDILSALDDEVGVDLLQSEKFKVLKYLVEESKKIKNTELDQIVGIPNPERIVKVLYDQGINPNQVIEYLINSGSVENKFGLEGIAEELPEEARRDVVNFMISLDNEDRQMSQYEFFGSLDSLPLNDAKELFIKLENEKDNLLKHNYRNELIMGTLYVVANFILNNGLIYLNSPSYDMNDIISVCNEIWIKKINSGFFLKIKTFNEMFNGEFFNSLIEGLGITKYVVIENTFLNTKFIELLQEYKKLKQNNPNITYKEFLEHIKSNSKYDYVVYILENYGYKDSVFDLFNAIINSFEEEPNLIDVSKTKLEKIKYILISNGLEYLREDINEIICCDTSEKYIDEFCRNQILDTILQCEDLSDSQKDIIIKRFGFLDGHCHSLEEIAKIYGVTREGIRQREGKILRILRKPKYREIFKDLI